MYSVSPARYAKGKMVVRPLDSRDGMKGCSSYLIEALGGRYVGRSHGYHMSPAAVAKLDKLSQAGFHANLRMFSRSPATFFHIERNLWDLTAAQALKRHYVADAPNPMM